MNIKIFLASGTTIAEKDLLKSFAQGVRTWCESLNPPDQNSNIIRIGRWSNLVPRPQHTVDFEYAESYSECDLAVIFGSWKPREKGTHQCRTSVAHSGTPFVVIETPLLGRKTKEENAYWRIGINGYLNQDAHWPLLNNDEADNRLKQLDIKWTGWQHNPKGHIVVALQLPGDASLRGIDINDWAYRVIKTIRSKTDRRIVIRNHPLSSQRAFADHEELGRKLLLDGVDNLKFSDGQIVPWSADLDDAYCTVTYSSGLGIDSVLTGIPTIACDSGNFAYSISSNDPLDIDNVKLAESEQIQQWLRHLAGCQWNQQEMRNGTAWRYLLPVVESLR